MRRPVGTSTPERLWLPEGAPTMMCLGPPIRPRRVSEQALVRTSPALLQLPVLIFFLCLLVSSPLASSLATCALSSSPNNSIMQEQDHVGASSTSSTAMMSCDYLVLGAGAMGMAFVDSLLLQQPNATVILVDKHPAPGGHWNDDYDYVKLHQPSLVYGVESSQLEGNWLSSLLLRRQIPFTHRANKVEILSYYQAVVDKHVASGQLRFFPDSSYDVNQSPEKVDGTEIHSFVTSPKSRRGGDGGENGTKGLTSTHHRVQVKVLVVDAVHGEVIIPATTPPAFAADDESLRVVTPNELHQMHQKHARDEDSATWTSTIFNAGWKYASLWFRRAENWITFSSAPVPVATSSHGATGSDPTRYVVLGCGKTGMDAIVYLRNDLKVPAENIVWVMSRDVWIINRSRGGPGQYHQELLEQAGDHEVTMDALEAKGIVTRVDPDVRPTAQFRFPTVSPDELNVLRAIRNTVRRGRVASIAVTDDHHPRLVFEDRSDLVLSEGTVSDTVFVHCTSPGAFNGRGVAPIYTEDGKKMVLVPLLPPPIPLSGAMLARIETSRRMGTLDLRLGQAILSPSSDGNDNDDTARTSPADGASGASIWRQLIRPYDIGSPDFKGSLDIHWNVALFLSLLDKDPAVGADWLTKMNRLSIYRWIQKLRSHENVMLMINQAEALGYSNNEVRTLKLLAEKLEPLQGR